MKKLLLFVFVIILITVTNTSNTAFVALKAHKPNAVYSFYVAGDVPVESNYYVINNAGLGSIVNCNMQSSTKVKSKLSNIVGESVTFNAPIKEVFSLIEFYNADIIKTEHINESIYTIYASSNSFKKCIFVDNKKVNLQIAYSNGVITVGTPIILGNY
jgi:hypothetical protein